MKYQDSDDLFRRIDIGIRRGVARALAEHKRNGQSIVVSRNGKIVHIPPEEIQIPDDIDLESDSD